MKVQYIRFEIRSDTTKVNGSLMIKSQNTIKCFVQGTYVII